MYDPIEPHVESDSVCTDIYVRAYAEPARAKKTSGAPKSGPRSARPASWFDGRFFVFDTETVRHKLTFGAFEYYDRRKRVSRAVFYDDALPQDDPTAFAELQRICRGLGVKLYSLAYVFARYIWRMRKSGGTITCFNASSDLSRLASGWQPATKSSRRGSSFLNGFAFTRAFETAKDEHARPMIDGDGVLTSRTVDATFLRIRRDDRHHVRYDMHKANVLDLATLAFALRDRSDTLQGTCEAFGVAFEERPGFHDGTVTRENVEGCLHDVAKTSELLFALGREYDRHPIDLPPWRAQSGASLAKAYLRAFGVAPRSELQDFPKEYHGAAASAYFGGWVEARIVREAVPCVYLDALSMYPSAFTLLNLWFGHVAAAHVEPEHLAPEAVQQLLDNIRLHPERLQDRAFWPGLAFFALVEPNKAVLPARADIPSPYLSKEEDSHAPAHRLVTTGPISSKEPLWYAGPDLAAAMLLGPDRPRVLQAWRLKATGLQATLREVPFRGQDLIDPRTTNPFQRLIELRKRKTNDPLDDELRSTGYKVIANSGSYGVLAQTTPEDMDPDAPRLRDLDANAQPPENRVDVWGRTAFTTYVDRPERHGRDCFFPTASLVTAGARLLLAVARRLVHDKSGEVAYSDTDSLLVVSSKDGGFVRCDGGPYVMKDGCRAVRALTWPDVERILTALTALKVYDPEVVFGSSFKIEDENYDGAGNQRELWFYGTREKSYALFTIDGAGDPVIVKHSAHSIGQYRSPLQNDRTGEWIVQTWTQALRAALRRPVKPLPWEALPAIAQLTLTTWSVMKHYANTPGVRPFDFLAVAQSAYPGMLRCCATPRPACILFAESERWASQSWRCLSCDAPVTPTFSGTSQPVFKPYRRVVGMTARALELKRLTATGAEPTFDNMRGLTVARSVRVERIAHIGKEVVVDPTDASEDFTAEVLGATEQTVYRNPSDELDALRADVEALGLSLVARAAHVSRSTLKAFVNQGTIPQCRTRRAIERAIRRLNMAAS